MTFKFQHPFTCLIAGPTQSGKTHFLQKLLTNIDYLANPKPDRVYWHYGEFQEKLTKLPSFVSLHEGFTDTSHINTFERNWIILDDLMDEANVEVSKLFTKGSHHKNLSVFIIVQNLFHQNKVMRTISLNSHYMIIFKNPRDSSQIKHLSGQLFPGKNNFLVDAYKQATSRPHGYLLLDLTQSTPENQRVLSDILPSEQPGFYYVAK